jgi:hypothetical protein
MLAREHKRNTHWISMPTGHNIPEVQVKISALAGTISWADIADSE